MRTTLVLANLAGNDLSSLPATEATKKQTITSAEVIWERMLGAYCDLSSELGLTNPRLEMFIGKNFSWAFRDWLGIADEYGGGIAHLGPNGWLPPTLSYATLLRTASLERIISKLFDFPQNHFLDLFRSMDGSIHYIRSAMKITYFLLKCLTSMPTGNP